LLRDFYPWTGAEVPAQKIQTLWRLVRNPLAHSGAVLRPGDLPVRCLKGPLNDEQIGQLDVVYDAGGGLGPALELVNNVWDLNVPFLYATTIETFRRLVANTQQMQRTEARFAAQQFEDGVL
jgi:hypothetical protein